MLKKKIISRRIERDCSEFFELIALHMYGPKIEVSGMCEMFYGR